MRQILLPILFFQLGLMSSAASRAEDYQLGQGKQLGNFLLSGYVNIEGIDRLGAPAKVDLDDLSMFASGRINRWTNPFLEAELSKHTLIQQGGNASHGYAVVERLYNDARLSEKDTLRIGKMLTPVGGWNVVHAAPLMPTVTRPLTTRQGFHAYVSGLSWLHETGDGVTPDLQLYWQPGTEWIKRSASIAPRNFRNVSGGQINLPLGLVDKIGVSLQHGQLVESGEMYTLYGVNVHRTFGALRLESEAITSIWSGAAPRAHNHETGVFGLADYSISPQWHGVLEWERYQDHQVIPLSHNTLVGVAYKPIVPIVWKLEYIYQSGVSAIIHTGWKAAFSALF